MRRGYFRVVAAMPDSGAHRYAEAVCTPHPKRLFLPTFSGKTEKVGLRSYSCGITAFYRMPVHANNPSVKTCGFATSPCTGEALGGQSRPPMQSIRIQGRL